jgi:hypothetical protein
MTKNFMRAATVAAALSLGVTANANAATINLASGLNEFDIVWDHPTEALDAVAHFAATLGAGFIDFTIEIENLSAPSSGIQSFGFNVNPDATSITNFVGGSVFVNAGLEQNLPSIDNSIDVCIWAANNCSGGAQPSNLDGGDSDTVSFRLNGTFTPGQTSLSLFGVKFQTEFGSFEFEGNPPNGNPPPDGPPTGVPEPASMILVGLGMASVLAGRRRN